MRELDALQLQIDAAIREYRAAVQRDEEARRGATEEAKRLGARVAELSTAFSRGVRDLEECAGVPDEVFEHIAAARRPPREEVHWRAEIERTPPNADLDAAARLGLDRLRSVVDRAWLDDEAQKPYRLTDAIFAEPLQLVGTVRVGITDARPQRFAHMLLVTDDHLRKHDRFDFFDAPMLIAEVAALGARLDDVPDLGTDAVEKLRCLPSMTDTEVAATVYELLVGTAARHKGLNVEMVAVAKNKKTPDFRIHDLAVPASIECKRRLGLLNYERSEATHVRALYEAIRTELARSHARVDVVFSDEVATVVPSEFSAAMLPLLSGGVGRRQISMPWGDIIVEALPYTSRVERTRVFAPAYMASVFDWHPNEEWDGIVCEVDPTTSLVVQQVRCPRALRWVSRSAVALQKKARGITSQWGDAMLQIPGGDMAFIYIAYPEVNRAEVADARTRDIMAATERWTHRWQISLGTTLVNRLYPRAIGV